ncbi:beta-ribofuranosylaminobenzene 5'-phosphate synthase family protein [Ancylobacter oerskovii]|uniref:Beta-ribofuranosylaminobenzene 5'-phosphate synthase family protein n=1 Tax=Ancylobacter oerskovii TaxID=459519 RepID=A0ABW4YXX9_9HYPH|nr:beta-ribofuranosylaminobenzene 5'-phosphate synthase family protein [Ancylobacter oerskovii]MBS7541969.1 GHMP kinase [Ancylobacter oerskovii]
MPVNENTQSIARPRRPTQANGVRVVAPARLHLGFLDLSGSLGRRFGSLGLTLDQPTLSLRMEPAEVLAATGPDAARARAAVERVATQFDLDPRVAITVERALPPHAGLGSGTQLALAAGSAVATLRGHPLDARVLTAALDRGARSGIGMGAFAEGGVLLDGGKASGRDDPPPILARHPFPADWRLLLAFDDKSQGLSGSEEVTAMNTLPPFDEALAGHFCRLTLMKALPALIERDCAAFGAAIGEIQARLGDHYARAQGGRYTSRDVEAAMQLAAAEGAAGVGQSSWGPTGFAILGSPDAADRLASLLRERFADRPNLSFVVARGRNTGARTDWLGMD